MGKSASVKSRTPAQTNPSDPRRFAVEHTLALRATDKVGFVADTHMAYEAVERLVTPTGLHDRQQLDVDRRELGALLRTLNKVMRDNLTEAEQASRDVMLSLNEGGAPC